MNCIGSENFLLCTLVNPNVSGDHVVDTVVLTLVPNCFERSSRTLFLAVSNSRKSLRTTFQKKKIWHPLLWLDIVNKLVSQSHYWYSTIHTHTHTQNTRLSGYSKNSQADMVTIKRPVKHSTGSSEHMWLLIGNQMTFKYYNPAIAMD